MRSVPGAATHNATQSANCIAVLHLCNSSHQRAPLSTQPHVMTTHALARYSPLSRRRASAVGATERTSPLHPRPGWGEKSGRGGGAGRRGAAQHALPPCERECVSVRVREREGWKCNAAPASSCSHVLARLTHVLATALTPPQLRHITCNHVK